jgi:hypothetical protein
MRNGILLEPDGAQPRWTRIVNTRTDACYAGGIVVSGAEDTVISACTITQNDGGVSNAAHGISLAAASLGVVITGCGLQGFYAASGSAIKVAANTNNFSILGNFFRNTSPAVDVDVTSGSEKFVIAFNVWSQSSTSKQISDAARMRNEGYVNGNVPDPGVYVPLAGSAHMGTFAGGKDWQVNTSGTIYPGHDGDVGVYCSGGDGTYPHKGDVQLIAREVNLGSLVRMYLPPEVHLGFITYANIPPAAPELRGVMFWGVDCRAGSPVQSVGGGCIVVCDGTIWIGVL